MRDVDANMADRWLVLNATIAGVAWGLAEVGDVTLSALVLIDGGAHWTSGKAMTARRQRPQWRGSMRRCALAR